MSSESLNSWGSSTYRPSRESDARSRQVGENLADGLSECLQPVFARGWACKSRQPSAAAALSDRLLGVKCDESTLRRLLQLAHDESPQIEGRDQRDNDSRKQPQQRQDQVTTQLLNVVTEAHGDHRALFVKQMLRSVGMEMQPAFPQERTLSGGKGGARVATAGPEAEGPSDVPPMASRGRPVGGGVPTPSMYDGEPCDLVVSGLRLLFAASRSC